MLKKGEAYRGKHRESRDTPVKASGLSAKGTVSERERAVVPQDVDDVARE